jgi:ATP-dependent DNA ligase
MIKAELLRDADNALIKRLTGDPGWGFQEKHNGDRRIIEKQGTSVKDYNRNGDSGKGLPQSVFNAVKNHPMYRFVLDVELVSEQIFVFDTLCYGEEITVANPYSYREQLYHAHFSGYDRITPVRTARTVEEKIALIQHLRSINAEGFVAKEFKAPYRPAEHNQRYNYRYKFWKTLDAVVIGDSRKRGDDGQLKDSVRLGCYDSRGNLKDICGSTKKSAIPLAPDDVVELKYLYGTGTLDVVQPTILRKRTDKAPRLCTLDQIIVNKNWSTR